MENEKPKKSGGSLVIGIVFGFIAALVGTWKYGSEGNYVASFFAIWIISAIFTALMAKIFQ